MWLMWQYQPTRKLCVFFKGEFTASWPDFWQQACASSSTKRYLVTCRSLTCLSFSCLSSLTCLPIRLSHLPHPSLSPSPLALTCVISLTCLLCVTCVTCPITPSLSLTRLLYLFHSDLPGSGSCRSGSCELTVGDDPSEDRSWSVYWNWLFADWWSRGDVPEPRHALQGEDYLRLPDVVFIEAINELCLLFPQGMFFDLSHQNVSLVNYAVEPVIKEYDRMVYLALSEFFFDSGLFSYYTAGVFEMHIVNEKVNQHKQNI